MNAEEILQLQIGRLVMRIAALEAELERLMKLIPTEDKSVVN
jgi:hypothetical protein